MSFSGHDSSRLERNYYMRVEIAILLALAIHAAVLVLAPSYVPRPYRLEASPLRLVMSGGTGAPRVAGFPGTTAAARAAGPVIPEPAAAALAAHRAPVIVTEQLKTATPAATARGMGRPGAGGTEGALGAGTDEGEGQGEGDGAPPLFYAYDSPPRISLSTSSRQGPRTALRR